MKNEFKRIGVILLVALILNVVILLLANWFPVSWMLMSFAFFLLLLGLVYGIFRKVAISNVAYAGYSFIGLFLLKMGLVVAFLKIFDKVTNFPNSFLLNFSLLYLLFLYSSMFLGIKFLNKIQN